MTKTFIARPMTIRERRLLREVADQKPKPYTHSRRLTMAVHMVLMNAMANALRKAKRAKLLAQREAKNGD